MSPWAFVGGVVLGGAGVAAYLWWSTARDMRRWW